MKQIDIENLDMEDIYIKGDQFCIYFIFGYATLSLCLANLHDTWKTAILFNMICLLLFAVSKYIFENKIIHRVAISLILFAYPPILMYQSEGFPLVMMFFIVSIMALISYQNFNYLLPGFLPALAYTMTILILTYYGHEYKRYFFNVENLDLKLLLLFGNLIPAIAVFGAFGLIKNMRSQTILNKKQLRIIKLQNDLVMSNKKYAHAIANGDLSIKQDVDKEDELGQALLLMQNNLLQVSQKEDDEKFYNEGISKVNEVLRNYQDVLDELCYQLILTLVKFLEINQGSIFLLEEENDQKYLDLKASYAYDKRKFRQKKIEIGQGLIGQVYLEKKEVYVTEIPDQYTYITSGLGRATASVVFIFPIVHENICIGVIELASFEKFEDVVFKFLKNTSDSIGATISSVKAKQEMGELLKQSNFMTEQMKAQEEEMRQNMEEMMATQEESERIIKELQDRITSLEQNNG